MMWLLAKSVFFTILVPGSVVGLAPILIGGGLESWPATGSRQLLAMVPLAVGFSIILWAIYDFFASGRGTLAPIDPRELVVRGPFRYMRNPMYSGCLIANLGWALFFASLHVLVYAAVVWLFQFALVVLYEEPVLTRKFGGSYEAYLKRVSRWIPGI